MVLIDTPGIGENDGMDVVVEKFVDENQVTGFIYMIKSDNGGGVDEDRVIIFCLFLPVDNTIKLNK